MFEGPTSTPEKKMKYKHQKYHISIPPSSVASNIGEMKDVEIGHVDMSEFIQRTRSSQLLLVCNCSWKQQYVVASFPVVTVEPEFIVACAAHFDEAKSVKDIDGKVVIRLDEGIIDRIFKWPILEENIDITMKYSQEYYNKNEERCKKNINTNWLVKSRATTNRWPRFFHYNFK